MNDVFFTADTHFNHRMCCEKFRSGLFQSLEEMNETIISKWNEQEDERLAFNSSKD
jgi:calcineurin-like phosphoesterase family protein